ncbi:MAG: hypothetical protein C0403_08040 [Desulfobacterium sp.]|nr:hypothetical protein [Desulfobacterium sp.]
MKKIIKAVDRVVYYVVFKLGLLIGCILACFRWNRMTRILMRFNAKTVLLMRGGRRKDTIEEIGWEWKRMFPLESMQEIMAMDDHTVYMRTHTWCPLRGTGDVHACHQLMEFDRALLETIGGRLVVLRSQAQPNVKNCEIAIRMSGKSIDDLLAVQSRNRQ